MAIGEGTNDMAKTAERNGCWIRINRPGTDTCARDLDMVTGHALGLRLPKVESPAGVEWVARREPGLRLDCSIESALGVVNV